MTHHIGERLIRLALLAYFAAMVVVLVLLFRRVALPVVLVGGYIGIALAVRASRERRQRRRIP
jgi:Flp pilus assembly protein TadB